MSIDSKYYMMKGDRVVLGSLMLCIGVLTVLKCVFFINLPVFLYLAIVIAIGLTCSKEEIAALMCGIIAFQGIFQVKAGLLIAAFFYLLKTRNFVFGKSLPVILMMVWEVIHYPQTHITLFGWIEVFAAFIALGILLIDADCDCCSDYVIRFFAWSVAFASTINICVCVRKFGYSLSSLTRMGNLSNDSSDFQGLLNSNTNSFLCLLAISALLLIRHYSREKRTDNYLIYFLAIIILMTQSKSSIICLMIAYALYYLFSRRNIIIKARTLIRIIALFGAVVLGYIVFLRPIVSSIIDRFLVSDITTGRLVILSFYLMHLTKAPMNWLFGIGVYNYTYRIRDIYGSMWQLYPGLATMANDKLVFKPCHQSVIEIVVCWGIVGIFLFIFLISTMTKYGKPEIFTKKPRERFIPLLVLFIFCVQGEILTSGTMLQSLMLCLACIGLPFYSRRNSIPNIGTQI